jgi:hypothetical protein
MAFLTKIEVIMKRSIMLLLLLPAVSACSVENDYYTNDYRYNPTPPVRVERPYYPNRYRESQRPGNVHGHQGGNPVVVQKPIDARPPVQAAPNHHGHDDAAAEGRVSVTRPGNVHGHD